MTSSATGTTAPGTPGASTRMPARPSNSTRSPREASRSASVSAQCPGGSRTSGAPSTQCPCRPKLAPLHFRAEENAAVAVEAQVSGPLGNASATAARLALGRGSAAANARSASPTSRTSPAAQPSPADPPAAQPDPAGSAVVRPAVAEPPVPAVPSASVSASMGRMITSGRAEPSGAGCPSASSAPPARPVPMDARSRRTSVSRRRLSVRVPVLSAHTTLTRASPSMAGSSCTRHLWRPSRMTPIANATLVSRMSPSGTMGTSAATIPRTASSGSASSSRN